MSGKQSTPPWQSKLIPYQKEIMNAWLKHRSTLKMIQTDLKAKELEISLSALSHFIRCRINRTDPHIIPTVPKKRLASRHNAATPSLDGLLDKSLEEIRQEWFYGKQSSSKKVTAR